MQRTGIAWTNFTSNPLKYRYLDGTVVWACIHASPGCLHCYAEQLALRYHKGKLFNVANMKEVEPFLDEKELHSILTYKPASGKMCFLGDMTDIFGEWVPFELIDKIFVAMALRPDVTFQILTKRADRMREYISTPRVHGFKGPVDWPLDNVWLGVSVENQQYADERIPLLLQTPAVNRFVSYEPALGPVAFTSWLMDPCSIESTHSCANLNHRHAKLGWIIVGGESGPGARPFGVEWARSTVKQCRAASVPVFVKQMGSHAIERNDQIQDVWYYADGSDMDAEEIDGDSYRYQGAPVRLKLKDRMGGDPSEWPEDLRVREFPEVRV